MRWFSIIFITTITILSFSSVLAQGQFSLSPTHPKVGDVLSVKYDASAGTALHKNIRKITCEALIIRDNKSPLLIETQLKRTGNVWKGNFKFDEPKAQFILFRFRSGDDLDDNSGKSWEKFVYGPDEKTVQGAHFARGITFMQDEYFGFKRAKDLDTLKAELNIERELYPNNFSWTYLWTLQLRANPKDSILRTRIKSEFESIWEKNQSNEEAANKLIPMFDMLGMTGKGDSIQQQKIAANPKCKIAENYRLREIFNEQDSLKQVDMAEKYFADFPNDENDRNAAILVSFYLKAKLYNKAASFLERQHITDGNYYNNLAWELMMKGDKPEQATALAKKGVDLFRHPDPLTKPSYISQVEWKKMTINSLGWTLDTYAWGLFKTNRSKEAEAVYKEAVKNTEGKVGDINARLLECYNANGRYKIAMKTAARFVQEDKANDKVMEQYKTAYIKLKGTDKGFEKLVDKAKAIAENRRKKKIPDEKQKMLKELLNKPEFDFTLKDLEGKTITLSELKGKVVVLDFWATWCGPCKASFPALQKICSKYKDNSDVVILAINTWEKKTGKELEDLVKAFIADNKYTFCVLYDEGFVEKYGVDGIPTKFIIDKKGIIRFSTVGFDGEQETISKMSTEIDFLLSDGFYNK